jgi:hypothetical protein
LLHPPKDVPVYVRQGYRAGVPPTWENDDLPHRYAPRITAFTVDRASFSLVNDQGTPKLSPESYGVRIVHRPYGQQRNDFDPFGNLLVVYGELPKENKSIENFAIPEPDRAAASLLGGRLFEATDLPSRPPDVILEGDTLAKMSADCLKPSDNYLAECLMLLAAQKEGVLGANPYGIAPARMRSFLTKVVGLNDSEARPYDGSGMSRHNFVTPRGIVKVLNWAGKQSWAPLWKSSLAYPGQPGTLSGRLKDSSFIGKTGSLNSVSSLSGYVKAANGDSYSVSILMNHFIAPASEARTVQDAMIREIEKQVSDIENLVNTGTNFGRTIKHESGRPLPSHSPFDVHRLYRPVHDRLASRQRTDRRAEPVDAASNRTERMAVRLR